jgi:cytochrome c553
MPRFARAFPALLAFAAAATASDFPSWAYPVNAADSPPVVAADSAALRVPDSAVTFTRREISASADHVPDWHPEEHPAMPAVVGRGRPPLVYACGYCHLPTGAGRPENASLAGLTPAYIKQQMLAFRRGVRPGSEPKRAPQAAMIALAKTVTDAEIDAAAAYFASIRPASFITVIESATVPKTVVAGWMLARAPDGGTEPIGQRIVELAEDFARFEKRDSRTPYVAYVPVGSLKRGAELVATGAGGRIPRCATCHGPELKGLADVPRLAGRSPSYLFRQLHDLRDGMRRGRTTTLMKPVAAALTDEDMVAIAADLASREP